MKYIFRTRLFWCLFTVSALCLTGLTYHFFPQAFPIVHLNISMDRSEALQKATNLAKQYNLSPNGYQQAVTFQTDNMTKTFVELEAGGTDAFVSMMENGFYQPYTWVVRHFKEFEKRESIFKFTPDGTVYGFAESLSENTDGAALSEQEAQKIAEQEATNKWNIDLSPYTRIEAAKEEQASGRVDHTFTYQRTDAKIGEGLYRLTLRVSGDQLTMVQPLVKTPQDFLLRYMELRSTNNTIAYTAMLLMRILYLFLGCIVGLFLLMRIHWVQWRTPLLWSSIVTFLHTLSSINQLPSMWMYYPTSLSWYGFILNFASSLLYDGIYTFFFSLIVFAAAESLTRKAFGHHPQLWNSWLSSHASSLGIVGRTIGGYLIVSVDFIFIVCFYIITTRYFGWWVPSSSLFNPNVLATYMPWLTSIATSLKAGFMEECLFRAVPLAGAALLGNRFGKRSWWIFCAFIIQAIIFGAAHANYPTQPSYARLVELIVPSFTFGGLYLAFGLLPAIISHFVYDVVWLSLPIFVASGTSALINQIIILTLTLIPVWIVIRARIKQGTWHKNDDADLNRNWQAPPIPQIKDKEIITPQSTTIPTALRCSIYTLGLIGLGLWCTLTQFKPNSPPIQLTKQEAIAHATNKFPTPMQEWAQMPYAFTNYATDATNTLRHRFIWQSGGQKAYQQLIGNYLPPPHWIMRLAKFQGDTIERAEGYNIFVPSADRIRIVHFIPEQIPGAQLKESDARDLAHQTIQKEFVLDPNKLKEISAIQNKHPERIDWLFTFADEHTYPLDTGQARIIISIAGNQVADYMRFVHVPEEWQRQEENKQNFANILIRFLTFIFYFILTLGLIIVMGNVPVTGTMLLSLYGSIGFIFIVLLINTWNSYPQTMILINTIEPFGSQLFRIYGIYSIQLLLRAALYSSALVFIRNWIRESYIATSWIRILLGICIGLISIGTYACVGTYVVSDAPLWPQLSMLGTFIPALSGTITTLFSYLNTTLFLLIILILTDQSARKKHPLFAQLSIIFISLFVLVSLALLPHIIHAIAIGLIAGIGGCCAYLLVNRFDYSLIPIITGTITLAQIAQQGMFNAYPCAWITTTCSASIVLCTSYYWFRLLSHKTHR